MTSLGSNTELRAAKRQIRFKMQDAAHRLVWANQPVDAETGKRKTNRFTACCKVVAPHLENAKIQYSEELATARYSGTVKCDDAFCPICAPLKAEIAANVASRAIEAAYLAGYELQHIVYTMRHTANMSLKDVMGVFDKAQTEMRASRRFKNIWKKYGCIKSIRNVEVTDGDNGYHYHRHEAVATRLLADQERRAFEEELWDCWHHELARAGGSANKAHGLWVRGGDSAKEELAEYFNKYGKMPRSEKLDELRSEWGIADEATRYVSKKAKSSEGKTPMQLLSDYTDGDSRAGARWLEIKTAMKGKHFLVGLKKFCDAFGVDSKQIKAEVAEEQAARWGDLFKDVVEVDQDVMTALSKKRNRAKLLNRVEYWRGDVEATKQVIWDLTGLRPVGPQPLIGSDGRIIAYVRYTNVPGFTRSRKTPEAAKEIAARQANRRVLRSIGEHNFSRGSRVGGQQGTVRRESQESNATENGGARLQRPSEISTGNGYHAALIERSVVRQRKRPVTCGSPISLIDK